MTMHLRGCNHLDLNTSTMIVAVQEFLDRRSRSGFTLGKVTHLEHVISMQGPNSFRVTMNEPDQEELERMERRDHIDKEGAE